MRRGFTLVELSIVLVIIGLLIGGILVAQSMTDTAKVTNFARQIAQLDIMVSNFKTKYGSLPGDSRVLSPAGNGNGMIQTADGTVATWGDNTIDAWNGEIANFFVHLQNGGMINDGKTYSATIANGTYLLYCGTNTLNTMAFDYSHSSSNFKCSGITTYGKNNKNYYQLLSRSNVSANGWNNQGGPISCYQAQMIDSKFDNGVRDTGFVIGRRPYGQLDLALAGLCNHTGVDSATAGYGSMNAPFGGHLATIRIEMLSQTGEQ